jgi:cytochrome c oxidase subunit I+III
VATTVPLGTPPVPSTPEKQEGEGHEDALKRIWTDPTGRWGWTANVQNGPIVKRFMTTVFAFFLMGGLEALVMRTQLAQPNNTFVTPDVYNQVFTMHGSTMMFLFAVPMMEAFAEFLLPVMVGTRELPFPRMTAFLYWTLLFGGLMFNASFLFRNLPDSGWFAYTPLSSIPYSSNLGIDFWNLGLDVAQIAAIGDAFEIIVGILKTRAPGMSLRNMPIYLWSLLVMGFSMIFGFTPLFVCTLMLNLDRHWGTHFFDPSAGGNPLLWQHLFWIFGHPEVYIMFIPATGVISMIVPTFTRRPLVGHTLIVLAMVATGFLSFGLWVHHMFSTGAVAPLAMSFFTAASMTIAIPSGIQIFAWIATMWGTRPRMTTPMLYAIAFIVTFVLGGISGVTLSAVPWDWQVTDTYYVVAHFHYVLIGSLLFATFAGFYYWLPKLTNRMLSETLGKWNFWVTAIGFNIAFFPMHFSGFLGMPRRVYSYPAGIGLELPNLVSTIGAYILGAGVLLFLVNLAWSIVLAHGREAGKDPWGAGTLDWATESPPPDEGYRVLPVVHTREPLWEQARLEEGDPETVRLVHALERSPTHYRATLVTSLAEGIPEGVLRMASASRLPLLAASGLAVVFAGELFGVHAVAVIGALVMVAAVWLWLWPPAVERELRLGDMGGPTVHGLPVYLSGTRSPAWWGMLLVLLTLAVGTACCIFSYFYIRAGSTDWPPAGIQPPDLTLPIVRSIVFALSLPPAWWALRSIKRERQLRLQIALAANAALGVAFLGLMLAEIGQWDPNLQWHAYGSAFYLLQGIQLVLVLIGLLISAFAQVQAWMGYFNRWRYLAVQNLANYWTFTVVHWLVVAAVLYASPYVL